MIMTEKGYYISIDNDGDVELEIPNTGWNYLYLTKQDLLNMLEELENKLED